jgi:hypothetical protein
MVRAMAGERTLRDRILMKSRLTDEEHQRTNQNYSTLMPASMGGVRNAQKV